VLHSTILAFVATVLGSVLGAITPIEQPQEVLPVRHVTGVKADGIEQKPIEITSPEDFAKHFGEKGLEHVKGQVDFSKEKVLWVTWTGSGSSSLDFTTQECKGQFKVKVYVYTPQIATADNRMNGGLLVMPKDAVWTFGG